MIVLLTPACSAAWLKHGCVFLCFVCKSQTAFTLLLVLLCGIDMPFLSDSGNLQVLGPQMNMSSDKHHLTGVDREGCVDRHPDPLPCLMSRSYV